MVVTFSALALVLWRLRPESRDIGLWLGIAVGAFLLTFFATMLNAARSGSTGEVSSIFVARYFVATLAAISGAVGITVVSALAGYDTLRRLASVGTCARVDLLQPDCEPASFERGRTGARWTSLRPTATQRAPRTPAHEPYAGGCSARAATAFSFALGIPTSVLLLRHLGVDGFAHYATVVALLGIVSGITDAGLTAVGSRELALREPGAERERLLRTILGLRLVVTPIGVALAVAFAPRRRILPDARPRDARRRHRRRCRRGAVDAPDAASRRAEVRTRDGDRRPASGAHAGRCRDPRCRGRRALRDARRAGAGRDLHAARRDRAHVASRSRVAPSRAPARFDAAFARRFRSRSRSRWA